MTALRAVLGSVLFNLWYVAWTVLICLSYLPLLVLPRHLMGPARRLWLFGLVWGARILVGIRWRVEGLEHLPKDGPVLLCSKHQSAWETLFFPLLRPNPVYILKQELLSIPFIGWYMRRAGMIAIDRKAGAAALKQALRGAEAALDDGRDVIIFPEGTRVPVGETRPYQPGAVALYARFAGRVPVLPVALNSGLVWGRNAFLKQPGEVVVRILPPIPPGLDRAAFSARLLQDIDGESARLCTGGKKP